MMPSKGGRGAKVKGDSVESGVYKIQNIENNKVYIGASNNIKRRFGDHKKMLRGGYHDNAELQKEFDKYGEDCFKFKILQTCNEVDNLISIECYWIDYFGGIESDRTYNYMLGTQKNSAIRDKLSKSLSGENNPMYGKKQPDELNAKRSAALKGRKITEEHREKIRKSKIGENNPSYGKRGEDSPNYGKPLSEERKRKISESLKKRNKEVKLNAGR